MAAQSSHINPLTESHAADAMSVMEALNVEPSRGLIESEAKERLARFGANELQSIRPRSAWRILVDQFLSLIVALLAFAAIIAWATGDRIEAVAILVVLALNALIGFAVEWQANRTLDALRKQARTVARVRRDGCETAIDATELVPGDIVIFNAGDRVPADARLVEAAALRSEEYALTGESAVVEKSSAAVAGESLLAERNSMLYLGTTVAAGRAVAVITATGTARNWERSGDLSPMP